jgi:hypothetical protein
LSGILDDLKADVSAALTGTLHAATLYQYTTVPDGYGGTTTTYDAGHACEGLRGSFNSVIAGLSGIPRTDAQIEILASSLSVTPNRIDKINIEGEWWIITEIQLDPSGAWWVLQCSTTDAVS